MTTKHKPLCACTACALERAQRDHSADVRRQCVRRMLNWPVLPVDIERPRGVP